MLRAGPLHDAAVFISGAAISLRLAPELPAAALLNAHAHHRSDRAVTCGGDRFTGEDGVSFMQWLRYLLDREGYSAALDAYWAAETPREERVAHAWLQRYMRTGY